MKFDLSEAAGAVQSILNSFIERLPYFAVALVVFIIFLLVGAGVRAGVRAVMQRNRRHYNLGVAMGRLSYGLIFFVGLLIALVIVIPGFTPGELVNILGLSSVAIGFAFRDILQNFLAGILLLLTEPFRIGDPAPDALVVRLADSSVNIRLRWWVQPPRRFESLITQDVVLEKIAAALLSEGFDLPFPMQQILFHDQTEDSDGDRSRQREGWPPGKAKRPARRVSSSMRCAI